ncbi:hypothetical protein Q8F55_004823 [Vanrija albida]|uniref:Zn(2)-C6 fungal-type domain-containing protein n=1 Tax=Vanrija albida TaxID=181172 RepID=A0ABR3PZX1_9TREE
MWRAGAGGPSTKTNTTDSTPSQSASTSPLPARSPPAPSPPAAQPPYPTPPLTTGAQSTGDEAGVSAPASSHNDEERDEVDDGPSASAGSPSRPGTTATSPTASPVAPGTATIPPLPAVKPKLRASRACSSCNRQKLRCDGQNPCGRCIGLGQAKVCEYLPSLRGKTRKKKGAAAAPTLATGAAAPANGSRVASPTEPHAGAKRRRSLEGFAREYEYEYARWHALARNGVAWGERGSGERSDARDPRDPRSDPRAERDHRERERAFYERDAREREAHEHERRSRANSAHSAHSAPHSPHARPQPTLTPVQRLTPLPNATPDALSLLAEASAISPVERRARREWTPPPALPPVSDTCEARHLLGFVNAHEAENLFNLYVRYLNPHLPVLDAGAVAIHVARRSIALFNAVCCVAARAFNVVLWDRLKAFAAGETSRLALDRSFESVQAQLVYATWNLPTAEESDSAYVRLGLAKRLAEEIDLPSAVAAPLPSWARRSIARTALLLYAADATLALELGKPVLPRDVASWAAQLGGGIDDLLVSIFAEWAHGLAVSVDALRAAAAAWARPTSPAAGVYAAAAPDLVGLHRARLASWRERAERAVEALHEALSDATEHAGLVIALARLYEGYAALVLDAYVLERALYLGSGADAALAEYQASAIRLIELFDIDLSSSHLRGAPDTVFTVLTYAAVALVHSVALGGKSSSNNKAAVLALARRASDVLARAAMTPDHLPAAQSVFLSRLIARVGADAGDDVADIALLAAAVGPGDDAAAHARALAEPTTSIWPPRAADAKRARAALAGAEFPPPPALPRAALGLGVGSFRRAGLAARTGLSGLGGW